MDNGELYDKAKQSILELFSDKSVDVEECRDNLYSLTAFIEELIFSLPDDDGEDGD